MTDDCWNFVIDFDFDRDITCSVRIENVEWKTVENTFIAPDAFSEFIWKIV